MIIKKNLKERISFFSSINFYLNHNIKASIAKAIELQDKTKTIHLPMK